MRYKKLNTKACSGGWAKPCLKGRATDTKRDSLGEGLGISARGREGLEKGRGGGKDNPGCELRSRHWETMVQDGEKRNTNERLEKGVKV